MFERYTEKARRTIFFARYEASQFGAQYIAPWHLMLGLFRENRRLVPELDLDALRKEIEAGYPRGEKISTSVDMPFSQDTRTILTQAAQEAEGLGHKHIGPEHMLLALMRDQSSRWTQMLKARGIERETYLQKLIATAPESTDPAVFQQPRVPSGLKVADTTRIHNGHEIRTIERIQLSDDGKQLTYTVEVQGPGKSGHYEITFVLGEKKGKAP